MQASEKVRAARKEMQLKRLKVKEENPDGYAEFYSNQPFQKVRAAKEKEVKDARTALRAAEEDLQVAQVTGDGLAAAQEQHAIATLVVAKLEQSDSSGGSTLTSA